MTSAPILSLILAAGMGTRMKSTVPKPLHRVAGRSLLGHVMATALAAEHRHISVIVGPGMENVAEEARHQYAACQTHIQPVQNGTAGAVLAARQAIGAHTGDVYVLFCDTPLLTPETLKQVGARLDQGANLVVLGFEAADPSGYGRLLTSAAGDLQAIREHKDASPTELKVTLCNSGVMAFRCDHLLGMLDRITDDNAKRELYLTDVVEIARQDSLVCGVVTCAEDELLGINDRTQLAQAEEQYQARRRRDAMINGTTLIAPETVWFSYDTQIGRDVVVEPNVVFGPGVTIADNVSIGAHTYIESTTINSGATVDRFAHLVPDAVPS
ncbi:MAG: NTP transferase domain-containing protein [Hyphomicrobiaceae bacterium]